MSQDDVLFGYRLQLFDLAGRIGVTAAWGDWRALRYCVRRWKRGVTLPLGGRVRSPGIRASSQPVLRGSKEVSFVVSPDGWFSRTVSAGLARIRANGSGNAAQFKCLEGETACTYRRPGRKYKYTNY